MIKLIKLFGITINLHWSLLLLAAMIAIQVTNAKLPTWFNFAIGLIFAGSIIISILIHEFAHALVGRRLGVRFSNITLFIFGGAAKMDNEIPSAKAELFMAAAGPIASFVIYVICKILFILGIFMGLGEYLLGAIVFNIIYQIGYLNLILAIFNGCLPLLPLDSGRILRAIVWAITKNYKKATKIAGNIGIFGGYAFASLGLFMIFNIHIPFFGTGTSSGIWIGIMGLLIVSMAKAEIKRTE